jgi:hypothetical protein
MTQNSGEPELPRVEPEIIPPERGRSQAWPPRYGYSRATGSQRIYVARLGPLGFAVVMLIVGLLGAVFLFALVGLALLWIPLVLALVAAAFVSRLFRR